MGCCDKPYCKPMWAVITAVLGAAFIACCVVVPPIIRGIVNDRLTSELAVPLPRSVNDSDYYVWSNWVTNDNATLNPPEYYSFYFYNLTNSYDLVWKPRGSVKPKVTVVGPYTFQFRRFKYNISFNADNTEVSYELGQSYHFIPELSSGTQYDPIITVDLTFIAGAWIYWVANNSTTNSGAMNNPVNCPTPYAATGQCLFAKYSVIQHLFSRSSFLVDLGNIMVFSAPFPPQYIDDNFQVFINCTDPDSCHSEYSKKHYYGFGGICPHVNNLALKNGTYCLDPNSGVNGSAIATRERTGRNNLQELGWINAWMGNDTTDYVLWNHTMRVEGGNNYQFQTGLDPNGQTSPLKLWDGTSIRSYDFIYDSTQSVFDIDVLRYKPDPETFSGMDPKWYAPQIPGLLNAMTTAQAMFGVPAPAFGSRPYFAGGDPSLMDAIECTNCPADQSVDTWDTYLDVQADIGKVLRGSKKVQFNAEVGQDDLFRKKSVFGPPPDQPYYNVPNVIIPLFWYEYHCTANEDQSNIVKDGLKQLKMAHIAEVAILYGGAVVGALLVVVSIALLYSHCSATPATDAEKAHLQSGFQPLAASG